MSSGECSAGGAVNSPKLNPAYSGARSEENCGDGERERPIVVPLIVGIVEVGLDPSTVVVAVRVEHVRVAVGKYGAPSLSPSLEALCYLGIVCGGSAVFCIIM